MAGRGYTIVIHRDGALESRQIHVRRWAVRAVVALAGLAVVGIVVAAATYGPVAAAAARAPLLQRDVARLRRDNARVSELARTLDDVEAQYAHMREMLGANVVPPIGGKDSAQSDSERLYVGPPIFARAPEADTSIGEEGSPVTWRWPLSVRSFRTRGLASGDSVERHAGLDLAVPEGSDVRAASDGHVEQAGADSAYGLFVLLEHSDGYESMYGHLSRILVTRGERVRAGEVIALTGNSGRSTAPHLHFEIRHNGRSVDPLQLVKEGN